MEGDPGKWHAYQVRDRISESGLTVSWHFNGHSSNPFSQTALIRLAFSGRP
jgi:hypothetical protein